MPDVLLAQLPPPDFRWPRLDTNLPLAAGYLAAWTRRQLPDLAVEILPWGQADLLGDVALAHAILDREPRLVGLSVYLWNAERSLHLAQRLHEVGVAVVLGGPEVTPENPWLWEASAFAGRVCGEGETTFAELLSGHQTDRAVDGALVDLVRLPSPYLTGLLPPYPDGAVWLETVRGCPYRCSYCNYGRRRGRPRHFPEDWLPAHLRWAVERGVREVYLMDPSFNVRADWEKVLEHLETGNREGSLALHTELVADALRPGDAARLAAAGLASCELGLQSIHPEVLASARRPWRREPWLRGARELLDAGVETVVGLILGLPGDTPERFHSSVEFVVEELPGAEIQVFPLALLPGTELRARAGELGLQHQRRPPYAVTSTPGYSRDALSEALHGFEDRTGLELDPLPLPDLGGSWCGGDSASYLSGAYLDAGPGALPNDWPERVARRAARSLTLWVRGWDPALPGQLGRLSADLPHAVLTVVLDDGAGWSSERLSQLLAAGSGEHYLDRCAVHLYGAGTRLVPRLLALVPLGAAAATPEWQASVRTRAEWLWVMDVAEGWTGRALELASAGESLFLRGNPDPSELLPLATQLGHDAEGIGFADPRVQASWRRLLGDDGLRAPEHRIRLP